MHLVQYMISIYIALDLTSKVLLGVAIQAHLWRYRCLFQWSDGCYQTLFQNYEIKYSKSYHVSLKSCLVCHHLSTPFLTYTKLITQEVSAYLITSIIQHK